MILERKPEAAITIKTFPGSFPPPTTAKTAVLGDPGAHAQVKARVRDGQTFSEGIVLDNLK
jgi:hypothetical protein